MFTRFPVIAGQTRIQHLLLSVDSRLFGNDTPFCPFPALEARPSSTMKP